MAKYNFTLARQIINSCQDLEEAMMGIHEDWFWIGETVWTMWEGYSESFEQGLLNGINGSDWGTPVLELVFKDGTTKTYKCYAGSEADTLKRIENEMFWTAGPISSEVQRYRDDKDLLNPPES